MGEVGGFGTRPYGLSVVMVDFWDSPLQDLIFYSLFTSPIDCMGEESGVF